MVEAGVFDPEAKLELVEGEIFEMPAMHSPHASTASKLLFQFSPERLRMRAVLRADYPILCGDHSQPRPDIALARWPYDRYDQRHPGPEDLLLVVEVADSSARFDRHEKVPLYGAHGIPEAWLVDVQRRTVEVYTQPGPTGHGRKETYKAGDTIAPQALSDVSMGVADLFPKSG